MNVSIAFSPGPDCRKLIISEIANSEDTLDICVFTISDNQIKDAIISAHHRGIQVRVISDNFKMYDEGSDIHELAQEGIDVRVDISDFHMHHKFMVVDAKRLLTGSYNWTRTAELQNAENIILLEDISIAGKFFWNLKDCGNVLNLFNRASTLLESPLSYLPPSHPHFLDF
jgi:phosphatidylserine/phosphatidylglycerophosphate/cardiolipin synthase-like enzyme